MSGKPRRTDVDSDNRVARIYEATTSPALWQELLENYVAETGALGAMMAGHHPGRNEVFYHYSCGISQDYLASFGHRFGAMNPCHTMGWHVPEGTVGHMRQYMPLEQFWNTPFYEEWCKPQGIAELAGGMLLRSAIKCAGLVLFLPPLNDRQAEEAMKGFISDGPHLARAMRIHDAFVEQSLAAQSGQEILNRINAGIVTLDRDNIILAANAKSALFGDFRVGASAREAVLMHFGAKVASRFDDMVEEANKSSGWSHSAIAAAKDDDDKQLFMTLLHLPQLSDGPAGFINGPKSHAVLLLHQTGEGPRLQPEVFIELYGLTPSESQLLLFLAQGNTIEQCASLQGVALTTARTHLANVMRKTNVNRQTDLVRLVLSSMMPLSTIT